MIRPFGVFFWRKMDNPGYDSCLLFRLARGWRLTGAAVFLESGLACNLGYDLTADEYWRTRSATVSGHLGMKSVHIRIESAGAARWKLNGVFKKSVTGCVDIDLGFTPATNLIVIRRLGPKNGERAEAPAAYLKFPSMRLVKLPQIYWRTGRNRYKYEAPTVGYSGTLQVLRSGVVSKYPGLFELIKSG